jgi:Holliday junction resolvase
MPNKKYLKGAALERYAKKQLEEAGFFVIRSAGSKSPVDLIAIDINGIRLIQVKSAFRVNEKDELRLSEIVTPDNGRKEIWLKEPGFKEFRKYLVY